MKKKVLKTVLILMVTVIVLTFAFVCVFPKIYLAHKYDTKMSDYKVIDYVPNHLAYDLGGGFYGEDGRLVYEYKVNGRQFEVDFFDFQYYDSYQMEDVEIWFVEDFKENIDENIDFVDIGSGTVYGVYDWDKEKYQNIVWTRNNINMLVKSLRWDDIYIKTDEIDKYIKTKSFSGIKNYNAFFDTNEKYDDYINEFIKRFYYVYNVKYNSLEEKIVLHKYDLPFEYNYCSYEIKLDGLTERQEESIIKYD